MCEIKFVWLLVVFINCYLIEFHYRQFTQRVPL